MAVAPCRQTASIITQVHSLHLKWQLFVATVQKFQSLWPKGCNCLVLGYGRVQIPKRFCQPLSLHDQAIRQLCRSLVSDAFRCFCSCDHKPELMHTYVKGKAQIKHFLNKPMVSKRANSRLAVFDSADEPGTENLPYRFGFQSNFTPQDVGGALGWPLHCSRIITLSGFA